MKSYNELMDEARKNVGALCHACPVCNGKACGGSMPGPGARGDNAIRNFDAWNEIRVNMDTIAENVKPDTSFDFFGYKMKYPIFAGPVGAMNMHYGDKYDDLQYNDILLDRCAAEGIMAFTGDGLYPQIVISATKAIKMHGGKGIPTIKPWDSDTLKEKFALVEESEAFAVAMDIDAAGLPFLQNMEKPAGSKTVEELSEIIKAAGKPFIVKGIMTVKGALKAKKAGASAIVVSNHGGRVCNSCPATAEVLPEIAAAVGGDMMVLVDGGIRTGTDIFKALALGADAVLIARPYVTAVYGDAEDGVHILTEKLGKELSETMKMCGCASLSDIDDEKIW